MVFNRVKEIIAEQLRMDDDKITYNSHLINDLDADSLDAVEIILAVEEEFGFEVPDEDASELTTVSEIVDYIESKIS